MLKRICELLAVVLILASLGGLGLSLYFIYAERFIESVISGLLAFAFLRGGIAFVPQEVFLFSDTVRNNVVFGRSGIDDRAIEATLGAAGILQEIEDLEMGLDTEIGERGITLSGGQRQRLALARAMVKPLPVLIMDDALSMVDTKTEERILNRILQMRRSRTNLIVSHRVSTIRRARRIIVLDRGELVEEGTHESLLASGGVYADLYQEQRLAEEAEDAP